MKEVDRSHDNDTEEFYSVNFKNYKVNGPVVTVPNDLAEAIEHSWPKYEERKVPADSGSSEPIVIPDPVEYDHAEDMEV